MFIRVVCSVALTTVLCGGLCGFLEAAQEARPNFVIVLCDDLGYGDLGCYGNEVVKTPNVDDFARGGIRFTHCYSAAPNCSPARTGLMTARTPYRVGIHNWIPFDSPMHVGRDEITVAKLLNEAGYATCHVGKWHMNGNLTDKSYPQPADHGFEWSFGTQNNTIPTHRNPDNFVRNGEWVGSLEGYAADLVTDEALRWLENEYDHVRPFFLYVAYHEPHEPIASHHKYARMYEPIGKPSRFDPEVTSFQAHHGNLTQLDTAFGRLLNYLSEERLDQNTLILFTSDNGPAITSAHPHGSSGGLRDKKGTVYEGGIRVPGIVQWKGVARAGSVNDTPICGLDVLPTLCELAGVEVPEQLTLDGTSVVRALHGGAVRRDAPLYWHFHAARGEHQIAMRDGKWKLVATVKGGSLAPFASIRASDQQRIKQAELDRFMLYDLTAGPETQDVAEQEPSRSEDMQAEVKLKFKEVLEQSPVWPEWETPSWEGKRIEAYVASLAQTSHNTEWSQVTEDDKAIKIETDKLEALIPKQNPKQWMTGIQKGSFVDKTTGFREIGDGLMVIDWLMESGSDEEYAGQVDAPDGQGVGRYAWYENYTDPGQRYHYLMAHGSSHRKRVVEGPQLCHRMKPVQPDVIRGKDFVAVRTTYRYEYAAPGRKPGSRWTQLIVFPRGERFFVLMDRIDSVNDSPEMFLRNDTPGCVRHDKGDTFSEMYLSYLSGPKGVRIPSSEFFTPFPPDLKFGYRRDTHRIPEHFIRAYHLRDRQTGKAGPWLAGLTLEPSVVYESWCSQRPGNIIVMIQEIHGRPITAGESFSAAHIVGYFDSIEEMHEVYDRYKGHTALSADSSGWRLHN